MPPFSAPAKITAYNIDSDKIDFQNIYTLNQSDYPTGMFRGPVGLAIDLDSGYIFCTHENYPDPEKVEGLRGIQLINGKSLTDEGVLEIPGTPDLSGVVYDHKRQKVYSVERGSGELYVLDWDAQEASLTLQGSGPVILKDSLDVEISGGGLALDETDDILYVTQLSSGGHSGASNIVYCYDPNDWTYIDSIEIYNLGSTELNAVGVAVYNDGVETNYLYTGAWGFSGSHNYLVRTDLNLYEADSEEPNSFRFAKDIGTNVAGIAVDPNTGLVYVTTSDNQVAVFDTSNWTSDPNQTIEPNDSETYMVHGPAGIAVGSQYKPRWLHIEKTDNIDTEECISPEAADPNITYTIVFRPLGYDANDVLITDYLPWGVDFYSANPDSGTWDPETRTYTWYRSAIDANDPNEELELVVQVNTLAMPGGTITNEVEIESQNYFNWTTEDTDICCWGGNIIYVDASLGDFGLNNGTSWSLAYTSIQDAMDRASGGCYDTWQIWVAQGTYTPDTDDDTFELEPNLALYGGFPSGGGTWGSRKPGIYETILSGQVSQDEKCSAVVTADGVNSTAVIDGFVIQDGSDYGISCTNTAYPIIANCRVQANGNYTAYDAGIYCNNSEPNIVNCIVKHNRSHGIYFYNNSDVSITNCVVESNSNNGIYCNDDSNPIITNCTIEYNSGTGIYCDDSDPNIINCLINGNNEDGVYCGNDSDLLIIGSIIENNGDNGIECSHYSASIDVSTSKIRDNDAHGIYCLSSSAAIIKNNWINHNKSDGLRLYSTSPSTVRNNTIVYNENYGIYQTAGTANISNCILWGNNTQLGGNCTATYSCIENGNDENGNINQDPNFAYKNPESFNFHLSPVSPCIDKGNSTDISDETDIDGDYRVLDDDVDMGADEFACYDVFNQADFNADGVVNLIDYSYLAGVWMDVSNEPNWVPDYDLVADNQIDLLDLNAFDNNYLWFACWNDAELPGAMKSTMGMDGDSSNNRSSALLSQSLSLSAYQPKELQIEVTKELLNDGTKIELFFYANEPLAKITTDPQGNITGFVGYLDNGYRVELISTYDNQGNETSAIYTHYDADNNIILTEKMEDELLLQKEE
ncbi:MAG: right-handed parallel beta-helix repeat-containing protein [Sedimentisphaerales bacterium]|nr:right-handed parallel beta-helix repeat-containing protein [Sedimentisphaerales bacterium]